jgi:hypothetical protein
MLQWPGLHFNYVRSTWSVLEAGLPQQPGLRSAVPPIIVTMYSRRPLHYVSDVGPHGVPKKVKEGGGKKAKREHPGTDDTSTNASESHYGVHLDSGQWH